MPGRFSNLEFNEDAQARQPTRPAQRAAVRQAPEFLRQAREEHRGQRFEPALRLYTRALQEDHNLVAAWVGQVQMLVELGEFHEARVWSDKALDLFRTNGELLAAKAQACIRLNDRASAYACSDASLQAPGGSPWRWQVRGEVLLADHKRQADECFQKALVEPGADWFDRVLIARVLRYHDRVAGAVNYLLEALELQPGHAPTWFELGDCQLALGLTGAARTSFARALDIQADHAPARQALDALEVRSPLAWLRGLLRRWTRR